VENIARMSSNPTVRQGSQVEEGQIAVRLDDTPLQYFLKALREQIARTFRKR
jgi:multidrug efflux pump subunit AcrA (membrane-fusion protein)